MNLLNLDADFGPMYSVPSNGFDAQVYQDNDGTYCLVCPQHGDLEDDYIPPVVKGFKSFYAAVAAAELAALEANAAFDLSDAGVFNN